MVHTLTAAADGLIAGYVYSFIFAATNAIGNSQGSSIVSFALVDPPLAPSIPVVMPIFTSMTQLAVQWGQVAPTQTPGGLVKGYVLYMLDPLVGAYIKVFDGSYGYPDITSFIIRSNITAGSAY